MAASSSVRFLQRQSLHQISFLDTQHSSLSQDLLQTPIDSFEAWFKALSFSLDSMPIDTFYFCIWPWKFDSKYFCMVHQELLELRLNCHDPL
ncbi:hypothetical protein OIU77_002851 [Salix suchowensis]|uniref:Uncharacterized protein n=1 Tax=Salix suchowensis TaxID=1278906 RepID=A0ABQ9AZR1_9ROSI|nr:hypothetical protein OIU77_002851 [Salix suchowensis]